jgi:hypothetical protein
MRECAREKLRAAIYGQVVLAATILSSKTHTSTEGVDVHTADVEFDFLAFFGVTPRDVLNTKGGFKMIYPPGMALLPDNTPILVKTLSQDKTPVNGWQNVAKSKRFKLRMHVGYVQDESRYVTKKQHCGNTSVVQPIAVLVPWLQSDMKKCPSE